MMISWWDGDNEDNVYLLMSSPFNNVTINLDIVDDEELIDYKLLD